MSVPCSNLWLCLKILQWYQGAWIWGLVVTLGVSRGSWELLRNLIKKDQESMRKLRGSKDILQIFDSVPKVCSSSVLSLDSLETTFI